MQIFPFEGKNGLAGRCHKNAEKGILQVKAGKPCCCWGKLAQGGIRVWENWWRVTAASLMAHRSWTSWYLFPSGCHHGSGQVWPHVMEPIFSELPRRCCNLGVLAPSHILGREEVSFHLLGPEHGHSYSVYLSDQAKAIDRYVK